MHLDGDSENYAVLSKELDFVDKLDNDYLEKLV